MHRLVRRLIIGSAVGGIVAAAGLFACAVHTRNHAAELLNIAALPPSASEIECASWGFTDVLERCSFQIEPADFQDLLSGYRFVVPPICPKTGSDGSCVERADAGMSHDHCCGPKVGPNFHIATAFYAKPPEFEHGGQVGIVTDASRRHVLVDLYRE